MPKYQSSTNLQKKISVLITGGSGLIGSHLTTLLLDAGYNVSYLSRNDSRSGRVKVFFWNPGKGMIDPEVFEGIDIIVHLAGANIGEKRWTSKRKEEILISRTESARFLHKTIVERGINLKAFISASAIGIYGAQTSSQIFSENDPPSSDFLGSVCKKWEEAADQFNISGIRTVILRSAVVLDKNDNALSKLMAPGKFGFLIKTGNGKQYMPWIHLNDLCNIYLKAIEDPVMKGAYNAAAPQHVTHEYFMHILARVMKLRILPCPVPAFVLRTVLGEMSDIILNGSRVSSEKILNSGYKFRYSILEDALHNILGR